MSDWQKREDAEHAAMLADERAILARRVAEAKARGEGFVMVNGRPVMIPADKRR